MRRKANKRIAPGAWFLGSVVLMAVLDRVLPGARPVPAPYRYGGVALIVAGFGVGIWAIYVLRKAGTTIKPFRSPRRLIRRGPFRFTRHPMYLGLTVALCGTALLLGALTPWAVVLGFFLFVARPAALAEEARMAEAFGERYSRYAGTVRRWI